MTTALPDRGSARMLNKGTSVPGELDSRAAPWLEGLAPFSCRLDADGRIHSANDGLLELIGREALGSALATYCDGPDVGEAINAALDRTSSEVLYADFVDTPLRGADGRNCNVRWFFSTYRQSAAEPILALGWDESARPQMDRFLLRLARIADKSDYALVLVDARGLVAYVNPAFTATTGHRPEDVIGSSVARLVTPLDDMSVLQRALAAFQRGESWQGRLAVLGKDNQPVMMQLKIAPLCEGSAQPSHFIVSGADVSRQRNLERQIEELQRMEAVASLASGLAHRFNNILAAISGQTELLLMTPGLDDKLRQRGKRILEASSKGKDAVEQLTIFSRKGDSRARTADICPVVRSAVRFIRTALPRVVDLREELPPSCSQVLANTDEIHQVTVNLLTNALEAFGENETGCEIRVGVREANCNVNGRDDVPCVIISVQDNGPGIPMEIQHRIFEPFFSTRNMGRASGMGLSISHAIITRHGGAIRVQSVPGDGALFEVVLPVIREEIRAEPAAYKGRILLVDAVAFSLESGKRILEELGYVVHAYSDPARALDELPMLDESPDLLICDLRLPEVDGLALARAVRFRLPGLPVLLCAGWTDPVDLQEAGQSGVSDILRRPAPVEQIEKAVAAILTPRAGGLT